MWNVVELVSDTCEWFAERTYIPEGAVIAGRTQIVADVFAAIVLADYLCPLRRARAE